MWSSRMIQARRARRCQRHAHTTMGKHQRVGSVSEPCRVLKIAWVCLQAGFQPSPRLWDDTSKAASESLGPGP
jgi:hypothetical protein